MTTKKVGRPKLPQDEKQTYQRVAVRPETHVKLSAIKEKTGEDFVDIIERLVARELKK